MGTRRLLAVLGLPATADTAAVKARYRELAKRNHPDVTGCASSADRFAAITDAYQRLLAGPIDAAEDGQQPTAQSPVMEARWNIRRKAQPAEYPSWFNPSDAAPPPDRDS